MIETEKFHVQLIADVRRLPPQDKEEWLMSGRRRLPMRCTEERHCRCCWIRRWFGVGKQHQG